MRSTPDRASLIQRRGDAELPADGRWTLHRASFVGVSDGRHRRQLTVADGSLMIVHPLGESMLVVTAALGELWMRLTARTIAVDADRFGFSRWQLIGTIDDGSTRREITLAMAYHGVHGRRDWARAWFTGRATAPTGQHRFRRTRTKLDVVLDLLFDPPTTGTPSTQRESELEHAASVVVVVDRWRPGRHHGGELPGERHERRPIPSVAS